MRLVSLLDRDVPKALPWADMDITSVSADSRTIVPGGVFVALKGTKMDGARFVGRAIGRGAAAVLVGEGVCVEVPPGYPLIRVANPHRALARAAARFYAPPPEVMVAVTGTNGKTSVVSFVRQIWEMLGFTPASLGTLGVSAPAGHRSLDRTTPDPVTLHALLSDLQSEGVTHAAVEASSHGLAQYRLDGVKLAAAAFTNLSRDHLDYHNTVESYFAAKARLFAELLPRGAGAVVNVDNGYGPRIAAIARERNLTLATVGKTGADLRLAGRRREAGGQRLTIALKGREHSVFLPFLGDFQAENALLAAGLVMAAGGGGERAVQALSQLKGAEGRLEYVAMTREAAPVYVDYAHTPDALNTVLRAVRPYVSGRLVVVFGAGGDRDHGKRALMGQAVARYGDVAIVTDDNPRMEAPAVIRRAVLAGCPDACEIGDRGEAIAYGMSVLKKGDVMLVAGKGHEGGQLVGDTVIPFSDRAVIRSLSHGLDGRRAKS
ncbi:MAG: UDP-N-acetylmuramoyl-L-alanyl-D-glutamate--2,6-diaminopimelate ligase [Hyphomicrobiales bacterium]